MVTSGPVLSYAPDLQSESTASLPTAAYPGSVYLVLCLDFQLSGNISGAGNIGALGITGNAQGSSNTSVVFCHVVPSGMKLSDALREALERFVFPLAPTCAVAMDLDDMAQVTFNGSLACSVDVSYGFPPIKFAAPGVASVVDSATKGLAQFQVPSGTIDMGAQASFRYTHSDDFTAIVQKQAATDAFLYIMRARKNEADAKASVSAAVNITNPAAVTVNAQKLQQAVVNVTGPAGQPVAQQVASKAGYIASGLTTKLNNWINNSIGNGVSVGVEWDQQKATSMLFKYAVNLTDSGKLLSSWNALCAGNLVLATNQGGLVLEPGTGINNRVLRSTTLSFQFFNLFAAKDVSTYFQNSYVTLTANGDICCMFDIGEESEVDVKKSKKVCTIHFVGSVDQTAKTISSADVDLVVELSATSNKKETGRIGDLVGFIPPNQQVNQAQKAIQQFVGSNPSGTLDLVCVLKPSAYGRLSCSEYVGQNPPENQQQDSENWRAFHEAAVTLLNLAFAQPLTYYDWQTYNVLCVHGENVSAIPDRRSPGNLQVVPPDFWSNINAPAMLIEYFLSNTAEFMNLCDDLHTLAGLTTLPNSATADVSFYDNLLMSLVQLIVKRDVSRDYSKPAIAALLRLANPQSVNYQPVFGSDTLTCTLTLT